MCCAHTNTTVRSWSTNLVAAHFSGKTLQMLHCVTVLISNLRAGQVHANFPHIVCTRDTFHLTAAKFIGRALYSGQTLALSILIVYIHIIPFSYQCLEANCSM